MLYTVRSGSPRAANEFQDLRTNCFHRRRTGCYARSSLGPDRHRCDGRIELGDTGFGPRQACGPPARAGRDIPPAHRPGRDAVREAKIPVYIGYANQRDGLTEKQSEFLASFAPEAKRTYVNVVRDDRDGTVRATLAGREVDGVFRTGMASALAGLEDPEQRRVICLRRGENGEPAPFPRYPAHAFHLLPDA